MINSNDLYYDTQDAIEFIKGNTGFSKDVIEAILESELKYMQKIGIIEEVE